MDTVVLLASATPAQCHNIGHHLPSSLCSLASVGLLLRAGNSRVIFYRATTPESNMSQSIYVEPSLMLRTTRLVFQYQALMVHHCTFDAGPRTVTHRDSNHARRSGFCLQGAREVVPSPNGFAFARAWRFMSSSMVAYLLVVLTLT